MAAPNVTVFVNSTQRDVYQNEFGFTHEVNTRGTFKGRLRMVRPGLREPVVVWVNSAVEFGGLIAGAKEHGFGDVYYSTVAATSWEVYCDNIFVTTTVAAGTTIATAVGTLLTTYLASRGITAGSIVDSTVLAEQTFTREPLTSVFGKLAGLSATKATWRITPGKALNWEVAGTTAAAWDIDATSRDLLSGVATSAEQASYCNLARVVGGSYSYWPYVGSHVGDDSTQEFPLDFAIGGPWNPAPPYNGNGLVGLPAYVNSAFVCTFGTYGVDDFEWTYDETTNIIHQKAASTPLSPSQTLTYDTMVQYPAEVVSANSAAIASVGLWERETVFYPDVYAYATLKAYADGHLASGLNSLTLAVYSTRRSGLVAGTLQAITLPRRNLTGSWLLQSVTCAGEGKFSHRLKWTIRATSVAEARPGPLALFEQWSTGGSTGGGASTGGGTPTVITTSSHNAIHLGGSDSERVGSDAWTPIPHGQVYTCKESGTYTFRAFVATDGGAGNAVQVRLYDLTTSAAVATLAASESTTFVEQTASVVLAVGHQYQAEVIGATAAGDLRCRQATLEN